MALKTAKWEWQGRFLGRLKLMTDALFLKAFVVQQQHNIHKFHNVFVYSAQRIKTKEDIEIKV